MYDFLVRGGDLDLDLGQKLPKIMNACTMIDYDLIPFMYDSDVFNRTVGDEEVCMV
jgi:hypothetical protein